LFLAGISSDQYLNDFGIEGSYGIVNDNTALFTLLDESRFVLQPVEPILWIAVGGEIVLLLPFICDC
jgi:hypothetical protein